VPHEPIGILASIGGLLGIRAVGLWGEKASLAASEACRTASSLPSGRVLASGWV